MSPTKKYSIEDAFNTIIDEIKAAVLEEVLAQVGEEEEEKPRARKSAGAVKKAAPKRRAPVEEEEDEEEPEDEEAEDRDYTAEKWTSLKLRKLDREELIECADQFEVKPKKAAKPVAKATARRHAAPVEDEEDGEEEDDEEPDEEAEEDEDDSEYWSEDELQEKSLGELKKIARETAIKIKPGADKDAIIEALLG
jgi:hypothetical protein